MVATAFWAALFGVASQKAPPNYREQPAKAEQSQSPSRSALSHAVGEQRAEERKQEGTWYGQLFEKPTDWLLALFTALLVLYTRRLYVATHGMREATDKLWLAGEAQRKHAEAVADRQAGEMRVSLAEARKAAEAGRVAADAALAANQLNREIYVSTHRAWVKIDVVITSGLTWVPAGAFITVALVLKNVGQAPAANVFGIPHSGVIGGEEKTQQAIEHVLAFRGRGSTLFPGDEQVQPFQVLIDRKEIEASFKGDGDPMFMPQVFACVGYESSTDRSYYLTRLVAQAARTPPGHGAMFIPYELELPQGEIQFVYKVVNAEGPLA